MRTVVHLSDLHFGRVNHAIAEALPAYIARLAPDLVAISGDFTQRARRAQFRAAREFLDALPRPCLVVPGNHDVPLYNVIARFLTPLEGYRRHICDDLAPVYADTDMLVLGVNTTRSLTIKGGHIRRADVERLRAAMQTAGDTVVKIVVAHHPFETTANAGDAIEALTQAGVDVFLTGHLHISYTGHTAHRYKRGGRSAIAVEAGTATSTRMREEGNSFNVLRVAGSRIVVDRVAWQVGAFTVVDTQSFERAADGWKNAAPEV
jgi:3',5'-cyclic AMP phosphodiesterase CpdA